MEGQRLKESEERWGLSADQCLFFDIRPARKALKLVRGKVNNLIQDSIVTLTQRSMHGRRVFSILLTFRLSHLLTLSSSKLPIFSGSLFLLIHLSFQLVAQLQDSVEIKILCQPVDTVTDVAIGVGA